MLGDASEPVARPARRPRAPLTLTGGGVESTPAFGGAPQQNPAFGGRQQKQPPRVGGDDAAIKTVRHDQPKVGRNEPCPCGSGKKYKKCHGATQ